VKTIFIGSSSEAISQAEVVAAALNRLPDVKCLVWPETISLSALTWESIEAVANQVAGAVLLAAPDDVCRVRGVNRRVPRTNVILEWGYLTGILGRARVALCKYTGVALPNDLDSLTYCSLGDFPGRNSSAAISADSEAKLRLWASGLPSLALAQPTSLVVHGYTGLWTVRRSYARWRGIDLGAGDSVRNEGILHLVIHKSGRRGHGSEVGTVLISVRGCTAEFRVTDVIRDAEVGQEGQLRIISESFSRQLDGAVLGPAPQSDGFDNVLPGPNRFETLLVPRSDGCLVGRHQTQVGNDVLSDATVTLEKTGAF
jgi:hypothetical protein